MSTPERRRAQRISVNIPTVAEGVDQPPLELPAPLAAVYERVEIPNDTVGEKYPCAIRDLSANGAFIAGPAIPLLSRVSFEIEIPDFGRAQALGWCLWRRTDKCELPKGDGVVELPQGFGILFEAIPLEARFAIQRLCNAAS